MKVLKIFGISFLIIVGIGLLGSLLWHYFVVMGKGQGLASLFMLFVIVGVFVRVNVSWKNPELTAIVICFVAFVGMLVDMKGNDLYNLPLEWLFKPELESEYVSFNVIRDVSKWVLILVRYVEYLVIGLVLATVISPFSKVEKLNRFFKRS